MISSSLDSARTAGENSARVAIASRESDLAFMVAGNAGYQAPVRRQFKIGLRFLIQERGEWTGRVREVRGWGEAEFVGSAAGLDRLREG